MMDWREFGRKQVGLILTYSPGGAGKYHENPVRIACIRAEI
jgi:hypothetical protein